MILETDIMGRSWLVKLVVDMQSNANGITMFPERIIDIRHDLPVNILEHILMHELTHAWLYECGFQQLDARNVQFPTEFICEFVAIHSKQMNATLKELMKLIKQIRKKHKTV